MYNLLSKFKEAKMIESADEFKQLRASINLDDQRRAEIEEASFETWMDVIFKYPELKEWVVYNKTIPLEILEFLSKDSSPNLRSEIANKENIDTEIFNRLKGDPDENVRLSLLYNNRLTIAQQKAIDTKGSLWYKRQIFQKFKHSSSPKEEIQLFGYNKYWKHLGIVNDSKIKVDLAEFKKGMDSDPDHFRHMRLIAWLKNKTKTDQSEIDLVFELYKNDIDKLYANNIIVEFYNLKFLNETQRVDLEFKVEKLSAFLASFVSKQRIRRKIINNALSLDELHQLIKEEENTHLKRIALLTTNVEFLVLLKEYKESKSIRNIAMEKMKKM